MTTATFGNTTNGTINVKDCTADLVGAKFTAPANVDTAVSISAYLDLDYACYMKGVIVLASTKAIIANGVGSPSAQVTKAGWYTSAFATPPTLTPGTDYILYAITSDWCYYKASGTDTQNYYDASNDYTTPTNPTDATNPDWADMSIYCTYNVAEEETGWAGKIFGASIAKAFGIAIAKIFGV